MPELIERGHVYIGLPPLYKLKQGKQELYLKDDGALNAYLINNAVENAELVCGADQPPVTGVALEGLLNRYVAAESTITRLGYRYDPRVLASMIELPPLTPALMADADASAAWLTRLQQMLSESALGRARYRVG